MSTPVPDDYTPDDLDGLDGLDVFGPDDEPENASATDGPPRPIVWAALTSDEAEFEWLRLNDFVEDLRRIYSLDATIIPPFWHRHPLLVEHLSALHTHWQAAYDPAQHGSAPFGWIRDLDEWKTRMREAVAMLSCRLDSCRPEQVTRWPGQPDPDPADWPPPPNLADRYDDFVTFMLWWVARRRAIEDHYYRLIAGRDQQKAPSAGGLAG